ncbi:MAG: S8 family serine peptidase [Woeseiaceae bacterium]|nr:S8 family serine peptidase [Woeseiaceae bacterium]
MNRLQTGIGLLALLALPAMAEEAEDDRAPDPDRDILVTLESRSAAPVSGGFGAPYRKRKRYAVSLDVRMLAAEIGRDYELVEISRWPIRSLSVYCIVFRPADAGQREKIVARLQADARIDSAQRLQQFETRSRVPPGYDDTWTDMQRSLDVMEIPAAHALTRGHGVRIAVVDSAADVDHEDLEGRLGTVRAFTDRLPSADDEHGTAIASIIGANANNARGIVGIAPEAMIDLYVACWTETGSAYSVCDSFTLARALDALAAAGPDIVNLSLSGPRDPLLERLLGVVRETGAVVVAAQPVPGDEMSRFPSSLDGVIGVTNGDQVGPPEYSSSANAFVDTNELSAPAERIVVALPSNHYDFRSGSSLAAAHASGVAALLLSVSPGLGQESLAEHLRKSQRVAENGTRSINACVALQLASAALVCR